LLVISKDLTTEVADASSVGINVAPETATTRAITLANRLVTDTE
jgi:hypothetical protein